MFRRLLPPAMAMFAALLATASVAAPDSTIVTIDTGQVQGAAFDGVIAFKGIPFAEQPVGDLRWRPPQKAKPWTGVRPALKHGHDCLQAEVKGDPGMGTDLGEDCLYLNVWRPAGPSAKKLPVMVWIYGGGLVNGGTQPAIYQGDAFARDGVVFVSLNYRLGRFGFFAHPALTAEHRAELKGNYAYMDQLAALQWVQRNIAAFGGDPKQVTLFGESAGGFSVHTLIASPMGKGLFQRAIVESGGGRSTEGPAPTVAAGEATGLAFAKANGVEGGDAAALAKLRALPAAAVTGNLSMFTAGANALTYPGPVTDGKLVVESPQAAYLGRRQAKVALMVGANGADLGFNTSKDMDALMVPFGADKAKAIAAYDPGGVGPFARVRSKVGMDQLMLEPARFVAATFAAQGLPAYEFRFDYVGDALKARSPNGAPHASEIPYVFDKYGAPYIAMVSPTHSGEASARDAAVAKTIHGYWLNFAKAGDPNGPGLPNWPRYAAAKDELMLFGGDGVAAATADPLKARMDLTASIQK